jgi:hypothetical protein
MVPGNQMFNPSQLEPFGKSERVQIFPCCELRIIKVFV